MCFIRITSQKWFKALTPELKLSLFRGTEDQPEERLRQKTELKQLFIWKKNIRTTLQYCVTICLLTLLHNDNKNEPQIYCHLLFATTFVIFLTICRNINRLKFVLISIIFIPHLVPVAIKSSGIENFGLKFPESSKDFWSSLNHYFVNYFATSVVGISSVIFNDPDILSILSLSTIFHCALKSSVEQWLCVTALGTLICALKQKCLRIRVSLLVGLIVGLMLLVGQNETSVLSVQMIDRSSISKPVPALTWQKFNQLCPKTGDISTQLLCSNLVGLNVAWEGRVLDISLERKTQQNFKTNVLSFLPNVVKEMIVRRNVASTKRRQSICQTLKRELKLSCDTFSPSSMSFDDYGCKVAVEMSRSIFTVGDGQKVSALIDDLDECLKLKVGSYVQVSML